MKNIKKIGILLCLFIFIALCFFLLKNNDEVSIRIAKYKGDKLCAISYTFDDGLEEHYTLVVPHLEKHGFRGTFCINGIDISNEEDSTANTGCMTWPQMKEMSDNGHEISNHGWSHKDLTKISPDEVKVEIEKNDSIIMEKTGVLPLTFCYPFNAVNEEVIQQASENRVGTRIKQFRIGHKSISFVLDMWMYMLIYTNGWGVGMTHGITHGYDAFGDPQRFWRHLEKVKNREDKIWVGTFREVAAYAKAQENTTLKITKGENNLIIIPELLLDKKLFTEQLTAVIEKKDVKNVTVRQDEKYLETQIRPDKLLFDFDPFGGTIYVDFK